MFYYIINCTHEDLDKNINSLEKHSEFVNLTKKIETKKISETHSLILANFFHKNFSGFQINENDLNLAFQEGIKFNYSFSEKRTIFEVPINFQDHFYYKAGNNQYLITNDLRFIAQKPDASYDEKGFYSLLKYGTTQASFNIYKNYPKIQNGYSLTIDKNFNDKIEISDETLNVFRDKAEINNIKEQVFNNLCNIINNTPKGSIILFSGGIDSTILALAAKEVSREDITLFNCSFGENDFSARLAEDTAKLLGLKFEQVIFDAEKTEDLFVKLNKIFAKPFVDLATIPSIFMINEAEKYFPDNTGVFIDGSGADSTFGGFGLKYFKIYKKLLKLPAFTRQLIATFYSFFDIWRFNNKFEIIARNIRKTTLSSKNLVHMTNSFDKILYSTTKKTAGDIEKTMSDMISPVKKHIVEQNQIDAAKMFYGSLMTSVFKVSHSANAIGRKTIYPFIENDMINLCFSLKPEQRFSEKEAKIILKEIVKDKMPEYPGFHKKLAFIPTFSVMFKSNIMKNIIDKKVLTPQNPVLGFINTKKFKQILNHIRQNSSELTAECSEIIWGIIFTSILIDKESN